jgi:putative restriction endonuclease
LLPARRERPRNRRAAEQCDELLRRNDGPMLEALKRLNGGTIHLPSRVKDRPDRDRLAIRFERFKAVA